MEVRPCRVLLGHAQAKHAPYQARVSESCCDSRMRKLSTGSRARVKMVLKFARFRPTDDRENLTQVSSRAPTIAEALLARAVPRHVRSRESFAGLPRCCSIAMNCRRTP